MTTPRSVALLAAVTCAAAAAALLTACGSSGGGSPATPTTPPPPPSKWVAIRAATMPHLALSADFATPTIQACAVDGWEDGIFISRDGLNLFCTYAPADLLSFTIAGADQSHAADYLRGPTFGMDLHSNPAGTSTWIQADILRATRTSTAQPFADWHLTAMARPITSEGAVQSPDSGPGPWDLFVYTSNDHAPDYKAHIVLLRNAPLEPPSAAAVFLPAPVTTATTEDNPHIERLDAGNLLLFFDSDDRPGGTGMHDIWSATSADDGATWTTPVPVTSLNTATEEEQPHLFHSATGTWWIYFTATNSADGKLGIFRAAQTNAGDWNSWGPRELVIGAGTAAGVGEPTLTAAGDLSFVVVMQDNATGTATDRYDADPWIALHVPTAVVEEGNRRPVIPLACMQTKP
jgi:hypothetical protein